MDATRSWLDSFTAMFQALELNAPAITLDSLPAVLLPEVVRWLPSPLDVARLDCTSRLFHVGAPRSAVEEGLRLRAEVAGRAVEAALPAGETSWAQCLLWEERRLLLLCAPPPVASSGVKHSAFVDASGQLLTCGNDTALGVLGQGEGVLESMAPRAVAGLEGVRIRTVATGILHTLACSDEGIAYSFGLCEDGQLGHNYRANQHSPRVIEALQGVRISTVTAGAHFSLALSYAGKVYSFGYGGHGRLGHGDTSDQHTPRLIATLQGSRILAVAAGGIHSLALGEAGEVFSFGSGRGGKLGHGDHEDQHTPRLIAGLQGVPVGSLAAGVLHSLVVSTAGGLYSFGMSEYGALGHYGQYGHYGHYRHHHILQHTPRLVGTLLGVRVSAVAAGLHHSLALSESGDVYSFGSSYLGQLGHGNAAAQRTPRMIAGLSGMRVCSISAGRFTSLAVTTDEEVYGWGCGVYVHETDDGGADPVLGLGLTEHQRVPSKYPELRLRLHI